MKKPLLFQSMVLLLIFLSSCSSNQPSASSGKSSSSEAPFVMTNTSFAIADNWSAGSEWGLFWSDEFGSSNLDSSKWQRLLLTHPFNSEWEQYLDTTNNSFIATAFSNGFLVIKAGYNGNGLASGNFTSARLITYQKQSFFGGKIAARIKIPSGQGIWPAFWLLGESYGAAGEGSSPWPNCGEIDIMENIGKTANNEMKKVYGTAIGPGYQIQESNVTAGADLGDYFHVYEIVWSNNNIHWFIDGTNYHTVSTNNIASNKIWVFNTPFYIILNLAVGGSWPGNPDSGTVFPQYMVVDWVRVYTNETSVCTNPAPVTTPVGTFQAAIETDFAAFNGGTTVTYGWNNGAPDDYYITNDAVDGSNAIAIHFPDAVGGGIYFSLSNEADVSAFTNLYFWLNLPATMTNLEIKPEGPAGNPTTGVQLTNYLPVSNIGSFYQYQIPVNDLRITKTRLKIPFSLWRTAGAGGTVIVDGIYYQ